jgi:uncharacterized membrane protein YbhN (UPF0104 family)
VGFASIAIERLIDGFWMVAAFLITASFVQGIPEDLVILVRILGGVILAGAVTLLWVSLRKQEARQAIARSRWSGVLQHVLEGLHLMGHARTLGYTALISLLYLVLSMFTVYALLKADKTDYSFWVAAGVLVIVRFATVIPNAPGNIGLLNVAVVKALELFEFRQNEAKTFSIIYFGVSTLPLLIGGAVATALSGLNLGELHHRARSSVRTAQNAK